jgi:sulfoxide reductase heme-binding subunit YedZ
VTLLPAITAAATHRDRVVRAGCWLAVLVAVSSGLSVMALSAALADPQMATWPQSPALWLVNRASGMVILVLFTSTTVLGVTATGVSAPGWWSRFGTIDLHRRLAGTAMAFVALHVVTAVLDDFVPIRWWDSWLPFVSRWEPFWLGLGTLALDLWLAVVVASLLRHRISTRWWRGVHLLAYVAWLPAVLHAFRAGTDTQGLPGVLVGWLCVAAVVAATAWRLASAPLAVGWRIAGTGVVVTVPVMLHAVVR